MALTNNDIVNIIDIVRNKNLSGGSLTTQELQSIINANSQKLFSKLLGLPNLYQLNAPIERRGAGVSRRLSDQLKPFLTRESIAVSGGVASFASKNIGYILAINPPSITGRGFDELEPDEVADRIGSAVVSPTADDPVYYWTDDETIAVLPATISSVTVTYYKFPTDATLVYTVNPTTLRKEYGSSSVELEWNDSEKITIAYMCLRDFGINIERADITQYAEQMVVNE